MALLVKTAFKPMYPVCDGVLIWVMPRSPRLIAEIYDDIRDELASYGLSVYGTDAIKHEIVGNIAQLKTGTGVEEIWTLPDGTEVQVITLQTGNY